MVDSTPPASPSRQQFTTPDRINARIKSGEAAPITNADNTPNRNLRFSSAYREAVRRTASAGRLMAAKTGATPPRPEVAAAAGARSAGHSESAPELLMAAVASEQAAAALKAHDDFTRAYSNTVRAGRGDSGSYSKAKGGLDDGRSRGGSFSSSSSFSEAQGGLGHGDEPRRQERSPSSAADEIAAAASFSMKRLGASVPPSPSPCNDGAVGSEGRSGVPSQGGGGGEERRHVTPTDSDEGRYGEIPALAEMNYVETSEVADNGELGERIGVFSTPHAVVGCVRPAKKNPRRPKRRQETLTLVRVDARACAASMVDASADGQRAQPSQAACRRHTWGE